MSDSTRSRILEVMARGIATRHYMRRFELDATAPQVVENVRANWWTWAHEAEAALAHLEAEGMTVVPVIPTEEMLRCEPYESQFPPNTTESIKQSWRAEYGKIWRAMLSASPYGKASMQEASAERAARSEQIPPGKEESK